MLLVPLEVLCKLGGQSYGCLLSARLCWGYIVRAGAHRKEWCCKHPSFGSFLNHTVPLIDGTMDWYTAQQHHHPLCPWWRTCDESHPRLKTNRHHPRGWDSSHSPLSLKKEQKRRIHVWVYFLIKKTQMSYLGISPCSGSPIPRLTSNSFAFSFQSLIILYVTQSMCLSLFLIDFAVMIMLGWSIQVLYHNSQCWRCVGGSFPTLVHLQRLSFWEMMPCPHLTTTSLLHDMLSRL